MSVILAIMCFYYGTNNIISALKVPFSSFETINWLLLLTGVLLILVGIACTYQANKEYKEKQKQKAEANNNVHNEDIPSKNDNLNDTKEIIFDIDDSDNFDDTDTDD